MSRVSHLLKAISLTALLTACEGAQTMFTPMSQDAERVVVLFAVMVAGATLILAFVAACLYVACRGSDANRRGLGKGDTVFRLGLVFPLVVLTALLLWSFRLLGLTSGNGSPADLVVRVQGELWWWRVTYVLADGSEVESANEVRLPTGADVILELTSADVLHSFWIPAWGGKMDMIPGRTNFLRLSLDKSGVARGQCAEYCGGAHALMGLYGVAMEPVEFAQWLAREAGPAVASDETEGRELFIASGCGACHHVRGEEAPGRTAPDLTHLGSRLSVGAGILRNDDGGLEQWLARHPVLKPGNHMPAFAFLSDAERQAIARYLKSLE